MEISRFIPAGKLLTIAHDAGAWYSWAAPQKARFSISAFGAGYRFWHTLCSPGFKQALLAPLPADYRERVLRSWQAHGLDLDRSGEKAGAALRGLCDPASFSALGTYAPLASALAEHLAAANRVQKSIIFSSQTAPYVGEVDYSSSGNLAAYALRRDTLLYRLTAASLADFSIGTGGVVLMALKSHLELLTAMSAAVVIRERFPGVHISLAEHRYEYFSLDPHMERLKRSGALLKIFDTVVEQGHGAQGLIAALLEKLEAGEPVSGFIGEGSFKDRPNPLDSPRVPPQYPSAFSPEPLLWTRLSPAGCYWGRCAFCAQGHQGEPGVPITAFDAERAAGYLAGCVAAGYSKFSFSDEAISGVNLEDFCNRVLERKLEIRWSCRCRCDMEASPELFSLMRRAGCREILFGLESSSERVQRLMHKYEGSVSPEAAEKLFRSVRAAGLGLHLSFMGGFPGETPEELRQTVELVRRVLKDAKNGTYVFNQFDLLPGSKMFREPAAFKISAGTPGGEMPLTYGYQPLPEIKRETEQTNALVAGLRDELGSSLGWGDASGGAAAAILRYLYFSSGHGLVFKSAEANIFENPLLKPAPGAFAPAAPGV